MVLERSHAVRQLTSCDAKTVDVGLLIVSLQILEKQN